MTRANLLGPLDPIFDVETSYGAIAAGNSPGTAGVFVTINKGASQPDPATDVPIIYDVVFAVPVTGFATGDVLLTGDAGATTGIVTNSGDDMNFTVEVTGMDACGSVIARITAGVCTAISDGTPNRVSTSTDNNVEFNMTYDYIVGLVTGAVWFAGLNETSTTENYPDIIGYETRTDIGGGLIQYGWSTVTWSGTGLDGAQQIFDGCVTGVRDIMDGIVISGGGSGGTGNGTYGGGGGSAAEMIVFADSLAPYPFPVSGLADVGAASVATVFGALTPPAIGQNGGNGAVVGVAGGNGYNGGGGGSGDTGGLGGTGTNFTGGNGTIDPLGGLSHRGGGGAGATSNGTNAAPGSFFTSAGAGYGGAGREWPVASGLYFCGGGVGGVIMNSGSRIGPNVSGGGGGGGVSGQGPSAGSRPGAGGGGAYNGSGSGGAAGVIAVNVDV